MLDHSGDGVINPTDMLSLFEGNKLFDIDMAKSMLAEMDLDQDGKIKFSEFERFMRDGE